MKGHQFADAGDGFAEYVDVVEQQGAVAIEQVDREKIRGAGHAVASVIGHGTSIDVSVWT